MRLTQVHRQSEATRNPLVAQAIREGALPCLAGHDGQLDGISFIDMPAERMVETLPAIVPDLGLETCQIISPLRRGVAGVETINAYFHSIIDYWSWANSLRACSSTGTSGSASFHKAKKLSYSALLPALLPCRA